MIEIDRLKKICGDLLRDNEVQLASTQARETIHVFWYAVMAQAKENVPWIGERMLKGRYEELVDMAGEIDRT